MKILMIIRDHEVREDVALSFRLRWPEADLITCREGAKGIEMVETESPDLVLMGMAIPDIDGFDILAQIRSFSKVPLLVVTKSRGEEIDRVRGLEMGADDYIVTPFSCLELLARVKAVLRRTLNEDLSRRLPLIHGNLVINYQTQEVLLNGIEVKLTPTEYRLLCQLTENVGQILTHKVLVERVWGEEYLDTSNILKVHIHRLRRKLGDLSGDQQIIITVPGRGYRFKAPV